MLPQATTLSKAQPTHSDRSVVPQLNLRLPQALLHRTGPQSHQSLECSSLECLHCLMSFGRYAYRHAALPSSNSFTDHIWVSEELLATTFRRFVNGQQRRYESRVPGPLEARRRLDKRRNTALASVAGSGPMDDIACLLGRNGREHMKWGQPGDGLGM